MLVRRLRPAQAASPFPALARRGSSSAPNSGQAAASIPLNAGSSEPGGFWKRIPSGMREFALAVPTILIGAALLWNVDTFVPNYAVYNPELRARLAEAARTGQTEGLHAGIVEETQARAGQHTHASRQEALKQLHTYEMVPILDSNGKLIAYQQRVREEK